MYPSRTAWPLAAALALALCLPAAANAQFAQHQKYIGPHLGLSGVGSTVSYGVDGEVAYNRNVGIGAFVDTWSYGQDFGYTGGVYSWNVRYVALGGTGAYHFAVKSNPKVDPFLGVALGYYVVSSSTSATNAGSYSGSASRLFAGGYGGVRYLFKPNLAGVARLGFGASYLTVGVDFKM